MDERVTAVAEAWHAVDQADRERAAAPSAPAADRLVAALLAVADTCRSRTRDGFPEITTAAQLAECARVAGRLAGVPATDPGLAGRARALSDEVRAGRGYVWTARLRTAALALAAVVVAVGGAVLGGADGSVPTVVTTSVIGSGALFAIILTARRPAWLLRAERVSPMISHHGLQIPSPVTRVSPESGMNR
ncbi:hypothetical protein J7S33_14365 [Saccharothrix algeriensis]|uniref:Uncharacterized protein n=1 Tax=Saccharothrix algeriensis TaxID=173560 RepID=A0A8T8I4F1_9PSEU|nr:hypothetical protein J7S33_14365 [Saccharothrix algeriensis]